MPQVDPAVGVTASPLARKLLVKPGSRVAVVNPPGGYLEALKPLPEGAELVEELVPGLDVVQVFVENRAALQESGPAAFAAVRPGGLLWVCYIKGGAKAGTDLNRDLLFSAMSEFQLTGVTLVAIDERWSAMRFRPTAEVGT